MLKNRKYILLIVIFISLVCFSLLLISNSKSKAALNPPAPMIYHDGMKFVFVGSIENISEHELIDAGKIKLEVDSFPTNESESFGIKSGTTFYSLSKYSDRVELSPYIFVKDEKGYKVGYLYYKDDFEKKKATEYMEKKGIEFKKNKN